MGKISHVCAVTGGAGFIGSHLVDRLLRDGHKVRVLDNFATGRMQNLATAGKNRRLSVYKTDIAQFHKVLPLLKGVDWVFHLAALADIVPSIQRPLEYHHSNVNGTASVLEAARLCGVKRFMYTASSSCYGLPDAFPTPETAPIRPMYPYALTKYLGEQYVMHWNKTYKMPCLSLRLFNVYGPRARTSGTYGAVFGVFLAQKLAGKPFTVVGSGKQTRDFTFVTDVADAFVKAAASSVSGEIFNVGSGGTYSINRLVKLLEGPVIHLPKRPGEPDCTFADTAKTCKILKWRPKVKFEQGVEIMLDNIAYWKSAPVWNKGSIAAATSDWFRHLGADVAGVKR
ncbi:MAG: NAD-dependent dehydratase [Elusimicrobia bacterium RIFOXYA2_FULL_58_8]|nr:MAG: NAD-dependent dehydratase [Elusimicrobia bacterium RIFOXYA2_FULL_58_8]OGS13777.1 MAG: NAD-dependent dehydratase [Elusimicrobia bacterium RIFOXYA12_FULL_57_11]